MTSMQLVGGAAATWDDGWYIDDVRVSQTLGNAPTLQNDGKDNSALPGDSDGDAVADLCDCAPQDPGAFALPGEVDALRLASNRTTIEWDPLAAGSATVYDLLRGTLSGLPVGSIAAETCLAASIQGSSASDSQVPAADGFFYLLRGRNSCGSGSYGFDSNGAERSSDACP